MLGNFFGTDGVCTAHAIVPLISELLSIAQLLREIDAEGHVFRPGNYSKTW